MDDAGSADRGRPEVRMPVHEAQSSRRRRFLAGLYAPWAWLVFAPFFLLDTAFWGTIALILAQFSHRLVAHCGTAWAWLACVMNFTRVRVVGRERCPRGQAFVIMSNHLSLFDVLAFYGHWRRQFRWVIKQELRNVPFIGWGTAASGHIFIDRSDRAKAIESLKAARPLLESGISVMIFPEGTRSRNGRLQAFKKGGFVTAMDLGLPILPVSISGTYGILPGDSVSLLPGRVRITIHDPIPTAGLSPDDRDALMARVHAAIEEGLEEGECHAA
jgi:1-acyl-sn-glycerol-3-phosphate acyltransferase